MSERQVKKCPILKEWCDEEAIKSCAFAVTLRKQTPGGNMQKQMCMFVAYGEMLSEINQKTAMPQREPKLILPNMGVS